MKDPISIFRTLDLPGGSVMPLPSVHGERVRILYGRVWLTEEGNPHDAFLASGEEVSLASSGLVVIEALSPARIQLYEDVRGRSRIASMAAELARGVAQWLARIVPRGLRIARGAI